MSLNHQIFILISFNPNILKKYSSFLPVILLGDLISVKWIKHTLNLKTFKTAPTVVAMRPLLEVLLA